MADRTFDRSESRRWRRTRCMWNFNKTTDLTTHSKQRRTLELAFDSLRAAAVSSLVVEDGFGHFGFALQIDRGALLWLPACISHSQRASIFQSE